MSQQVEYLQIEPTTRCNYTCGFCAGRHMQQRDLEFKQFTDLIDSVDNLKHIELQGEGEPLLHPQFFDMIDYARARFAELKISFISNGSLFTQDNITRILNAKVHTILVSIESPDEAEFQAIRGGKLSRVKRGIADLIAQKQLANSSLKVGFAVTVLKQTVAQINHIGELYTALGMDGGIIIQPLQSMACYTQFYDDNMRQSIPNQQQRAQLNTLIASDNVLKYALNTYRATKSFYSDLFSRVPVSANRCAWLENGLYISADGIANACCFVKDSEKAGFAAIDSNLSMVLEKRSQLAQTLQQGKIPAQCQDCSIANSIVKHTQAAIQAPKINFYNPINSGITTMNFRPKSE